MPQDAFTIGYVAEELSKLLTGGKVSRITQSDRDSLTFIIYTQKGNIKLDLCLSARACRISLTDLDKPAPDRAPSFCMLLRKRLANASITSVEQIPFERVVAINFDSTSEFELSKLTLYVELMGKYSNATLVQNGVILGALKSTAIGENTKRVLFSGVKYVLPEPQDKILPNDGPAMEKALSQPTGDLTKLISEKIKGVAYSTAADIVETYGENATPAQVCEYLCGGFKQPCVTFSDGEPEDFRVRSSSDNKKLYPTLLEAQKAYYDFLYVKTVFAEQKKQLSSALSAAVKKLEKRLQIINQKLLDSRDAETVKLKGELLTANLHAVQKGADSFEAINYYDENGGTIKIALDKSLSPSANAQNYFRRYAKLKRTRQAAGEQKSQTEGQLDYLNSIEAHLGTAENTVDLREIAEELKKIGLIKDETRAGKQKREDPPFRSYTIDGFKVLAGRNNIQNDRLLKSVAPADTWLHTHGYHSSHVVICAEGKAVPDSVLLAAAEICAYYSDGRGGSKIPVDYTERRRVKKPASAAAGFVIYSEYKTILAEPNPHTGEQNGK